VQSEPAWNSPSTRELAVRVCFDCHSNQTVWPRYSHVAPASWLIQHHVDSERATLNFSEWNRSQSEAGEAAEVMQEGEIPPRSYLLAHPKAWVSAAEYQALVEGLHATLGGQAGHEEHEDWCGVPMVRAVRREELP
jgi:heme-binding protein